MNRERLAWIVSTLVIALLALNLPGSLAQRDDDYLFVRTLIDIHRQVTVNYVDKVDAEKLREGALTGMLSQLDPFTVYIPPAQEKAFNQAIEGSFEGVGIQLNQLDNGIIEVVTPLDGSPAFRAGVQAGDVILKVAGLDTAGKRLEEVIANVKGPVGSEVTLTVRRVTGQVLDLTMQRLSYVIPTLKGYDRNVDNTWNYWVLRNPKVAYIRITQFTTDTGPALEPVVRKLVAEGMQGLILDLRFNPGGRLEQAIQAADLFLDSGTIVSTKGRNRPETVVAASPENPLPWFPMAVLVNDASASASEILAGALSDNRRAVIVGTRTYGKGSVQELIKLPGNQGELKLTVAHYYLPSGRLVHRKRDSTDWGVDPQIPVPMDDTTERAVWEARLDSENFRRPSTLPSSPTTQPLPPPLPPKSSPTTSPTLADTQLQQALNTLVALALFGDRAPKLAPTPPPTTSPSR